MGALMVSSEGACAAYYQFGDKKQINVDIEVVEEAIA